MGRVVHERVIDASARGLPVVKVVVVAGWINVVRRWVTADVVGVVHGLAGMPIELEVQRVESESVVVKSALGWSHLAEIE